MSNKSDNVIVLTTGISGSSLVTNLIAKAGFWPGDETIIKNNSSGQYNTFENCELVNLNEQLFSELDLTYRTNEFYSEKYHVLFDNARHKIDLRPYQNFIAQCQLHSPWVWKDPRLRVTLPFWLPELIEFDCKFIIVHRNIWSLWVSLINKRQIISYSKLKLEETKTINSILKMLRACKLDTHLICYDELITKPEKNINKLNCFLQTHLSIVDFYGAMDPKLIHMSKSLVRQFKAILIYIKNYF